ncbi:MAG: BrnT family toxin [Treponema sp.]|nr:BrnT family toxin [Treponema sp.]
MTFEWDDEKNRLNQKIHGIAFEDAKFVFKDPLKVIIPDIYHSEIEERWLAIGIVSRVLFVVFTERSENIIRIISARTATKAEEKLYNDSNK